MNHVVQCTQRLRKKRLFNFLNICPKLVTTAHFVIVKIIGGCFLQHAVHMLLVVEHDMSLVFTSCHCANYGAM